MSGYSALVGPGLSFAGVDQGIDFTGPGDVYLPYGAVVTRVLPSGSGWPGQGAVINVKLIEGPAAGRYLYYAEDLAPQVRVGDRLPAGTIIARATGSGKAPGIEIGWAQASGLPLAPRPPARPAPQYTQEGDAFNRFIQAVTEVKTHQGGGGVTGTIGDVAGSVGAAVTGLPGTIGGAATHIPGVAQVESIGSFLGKLTDPHYVLRGLQIVAGGALVMVGMVLLARQVALAPDIPDPGRLAAATTRAAPVAAVE